MDLMNREPTGFGNNYIIAHRRYSVGIKKILKLEKYRDRLL
jgi:hypothetical protein